MPRPLKFPPCYPIGDDLEFTKTYKKLNFLPIETWQRWYQEEGFTDSDRQELIDKTKKVKSQYSRLKNTGTFDYSQTFEFHKVPKIAVDRIARATNLYYSGFVQFQWEANPSGLYFLIHFPEANARLEQELSSALAFLGEEGIGGERSSGAGRFEAEWLPLSENWRKIVSYIGNYYSIISVFWDSSIVPNWLENASYEFQERGGWVTSPFFWATNTPQNSKNVYGRFSFHELSRG